jgi:hypothetical protein
MKKLLTTAAIVASLLTGSIAHAGDTSAKDKDNLVLAIVGAHIHEKLCGTEQSPEVKKMTALMAQKIGADWSTEEAQAKLDLIKEDFTRKGIGPWCREVTAAFHTWAE